MCIRDRARAAAKPGDIIILSPASASFDLYPNFEVRGREFKKIVNALKMCIRDRYHGLRHPVSAL